MRAKGLAHIGPGHRIAGYVLDECLGEGGFARVFVARRERDGLRLAIKLHANANRTLVRRFQREIGLLAQLDHPVIPRLIDAGVQPDVLYLVTELHAARGLDRLMKERRGAWPAAEVVALASELAGALAHCHASGIVHRDVKPANILVKEDGHPLLVDFGLGRHIEQTSITALGEVFGTVRYMSPEHLEPDLEIDGRADQYQLALVTYEMLTGQHPLPALEVGAGAVLRFESPIAPPSSVAPGVAPWLDGALLRALRARREERYADMRAFRDALLGTPAAPPAPAPAVRSGLLGVLAAVVALSTLVFGVLTVVPRRDAPALLPFYEAVGAPDLQIEMLPVAGATYRMGTPEDRPVTELLCERPPRQITVASFYMSRCEVTQAVFQGLMGVNPSATRGAQLPVDSVRWEEALTFCAALSRKSGRAYRLPTEAEWELACRSGNATDFPWGDSISGCQLHAWTGNNSARRSHPVGTRRATGPGFHDLLGNVWEWTADTVADCQGGPAGNPMHHVMRGGSFLLPDDQCRSAVRATPPVGQMGVDVGFRVVTGRSPEGGY